ncbi:MAG: hypothetical protein JNL60_19445 [Bacteroidia bacterium]|nr:hypothetical protein [Bacteroidia bacterium]
MKKKHFHSSERPLSPARNSDNIRNTIKNGIVAVKKEPQIDPLKSDRFMIKKTNDSWDY